MHARHGKRAVLADQSGVAARKWARWLPISYALFAGLLGTQSVLYGKTMSMLLRTTFSGDSQFVRRGLGAWGSRRCTGWVLLANGVDRISHTWPQQALLAPVRSASPSKPSPAFPPQHLNPHPLPHAHTTPLLSPDPQTNWYTYIAIFLFLLFATFWMRRYSKAMKLFPVLIIMPIIQIVWVLFSLISGSLYYQVGVPRPQPRLASSPSARVAAAPAKAPVKHSCGCPCLVGHRSPRSWQLCWWACGCTASVGCTACLRRVPCCLGAPQEYKTLNALSGSMFGLGVVVLLVGVHLLTGGKPAVQQVRAGRVGRAGWRGPAAGGTVRPQSATRGGQPCQPRSLPHPGLSSRPRTFPIHEHPTHPSLAAPPAAQPPQPKPLELELTEEEGGRGEAPDREALRSKAPLSDGLDAGVEVEVSAAGALEPEEALVARRLSTVYERKSAQPVGGGGGGASAGARPASAPAARHAGGWPEPDEGSASEASASASALVLGGVRDSAAPESALWPAANGASPAAPPAGVAARQPSARSLATQGAALSEVVVSTRTKDSGTSTPGAGEGRPASAAAAAAAALGSSPPPASLMQDLRADWGVGVRDLNAVVRASVGLPQDDEEGTAISLWSMPMPASASFTGQGRARRCSTPRRMLAAPHARCACVAAARARKQLVNGCTDWRGAMNVSRPRRAWGPPTMA